MQNVTDAEIGEMMSENDSLGNGPSPPPASTNAPCNQSILLIPDLPAASQAPPAKPEA